MLYITYFIWRCICTMHIDLFWDSCDVKCKFFIQNLYALNSMNSYHEQLLKFTRGKYEFQHSIFSSYYL